MQAHSALNAPAGISRARDWSRPPPPVRLLRHRLPSACARSAAGYYEIPGAEHRPRPSGVREGGSFGQRVSGFGRSVAHGCQGIL